MKCAECKTYAKASNCQTCYRQAKEDLKFQKKSAKKQLENIVHMHDMERSHNAEVLEKEQSKYRVFVIDLFTLLTEVPWWKLRKTLREFVEREKK